MKQRFSFSLRTRRAYILLAALLLATMFLANHLHAMRLPQDDGSVENDPSVPKITLEDLQNTGCDPSRYILFNPNDNEVTIVQTFHEQPDFVIATLEDTIGANEQITVDLDTDAIPTGFEGYVDITSNMPITGTILPDELIATFSFDLSQPIAPARADFFNLACGDFTDAMWDFGDGETSTVLSPSHTYSLPGIYTATLTVSNDQESDTQSNQIEVKRAIFLPVALR